MKAEIKVTGMACEHCESAVKTALMELGGVKSASADAKTGNASVEYDEAKVTLEQMKKAIYDAGFEA